ncbi:MAG: hypothetical protein O9292_15275 [Rhodobacteraceae bacterium]|nr:hypothetical protein [Paracoccaceae bacterium]
MLVEAQKSLDRIQAYDVEGLARSNELGVAFEFTRAVPLARQTVEVFKQIPVNALDFFAEPQLQTIKASADNCFALFDEIVKFDPTKGDSQTRRDTIIANIESNYSTVFTSLYPLISYANSRSANFMELAAAGRATVQGVRDQVAELVKEIESTKNEAKSILDEARKTAAERGVSQEAFHFATAGDEHAKLATKWRKYMVNVSLLVLAYVAFTFIAHKIPFIAPANTFEAAQFIASKILGFLVLGYLLTICAKNFLNHKHNEIVNRHRQNALLTYKALVGASAAPEARDVVLQQAAHAIYQLHDTGYVKTGDNVASQTIVDLASRIPTAQS